jgi:hypothetical protein
LSRSSVADVGRALDEQVAREHGALLRQIDDDVAARMAATEEEQPDFASAAEEREVIGERHCGRLHRDGLHALGLHFEHLQLRVELAPFGGVGCLRDPAPQLGDAVGQAADEKVPAPAAGRVTGSEPAPRVIVADDLDLRAVDLVAVRVIPVPVRVDHVADRLGRDGRELFAKGPGATRRHMGIDDEHVVVAHDDGRVAPYGQRAGAHRVVHARRDLSERERLACVGGSGGPSGILSGGPRCRRCGDRDGAREGHGCQGEPAASSRHGREAYSRRPAGSRGNRAKRPAFVRARPHPT